MDVCEPPLSEYALTVSCPDQKGIIAAVTHCIAENGGNILSLSQQSAGDIGLFMLRAVFRGEPPFSQEQFQQSFLPLVQKYRMTWELYDRARKERVAILVSKTSHCLYELLLKHQDGQLRCEFPVIISNHADLRPVAQQFQIPFFWVEAAKGKAAYEDQVQKILEDHGITTVVLARYMQILSPEFTRRWSFRIINIHHGFLPAFMGAKPYHQAWHKGVKIIGATAHFANEDLDQGPIICQDVARVEDSLSIAEFVQLGKDVERRVLFEALRLYLEKNVFVYGGRTFILSKV
ncbi:MAG: formyltetrahydrofolate deformylase [Spirochaetales bacterium]|nr:formyltetrahydrofolate deformylase [Spirochaetales bacterium]